MSPKAKKKAAPAKAKSAKPVKKAAPAKVAPISSALVSKPNGQIDVLVWFRAKKGKEAPLARALKTLVGPSRAEQGCLAFDLYPSGAGDFFLHEIWSSESDLANHRQTPHFKHWAGLQSAVMESRRRYLAE